MRIKVDEANDALYFRLDESAIMESEEVQPGVILDYDEHGQVVGIEILGLKSRVPKEQLKRLQFETV
ncbi:MAG: hypothetical protein A2Y60_04630 [Chloroflexi bacterium RBG_13_54_9]|nr:MAG: hypothetical protein A2Y60_04630 [Chloroflexi bacterium RBG_13_54_9]